MVRAMPAALRRARADATGPGVTPTAVSKYVGGESGGDDRFRNDPGTIAIDTPELIADPLSAVSGR